MLALTFQVGPHRLVLDTRQIQKVVPRVCLQAVAGGPACLAGIFVYRGQVVPVIDLHRLMGVGDCPEHLSARIILVPRSPQTPHRLLGLLAAQVADLRDIQVDSQALFRLTLPGQPDLGPILADGQGTLHLLDLERLLPESVQSQLAALKEEPPA